MWALVAHEDVDVRQTICTLLEEEGGLVVSDAADGLTALQILRTSLHPLIVVLQGRLPSLSAVELLGEVAADARLAMRHAYIVVSAASDYQQRLADLPPALAVTFLAAPFELESFMAAVAAAGRRLLPALPETAAPGEPSIRPRVPSHPNEVKRPEGE